MQNLFLSRVYLPCGTGSKRSEYFLHAWTVSTLNMEQTQVSRGTAAFPQAVIRNHGLCCTTTHMRTIHTVDNPLWLSAKSTHSQTPYSVFINSSHLCGVSASSPRGGQQASCPRSEETTTTTTQRVTSYPRSDLKDQQPEILAPAQSCRVMSAIGNSLLASSSPVTVATQSNNDHKSRWCSVGFSLLYRVHSQSVSTESKHSSERIPRCCRLCVCVCVSGTKRICGLLCWY